MPSYESELREYYAKRCEILRDGNVQLQSVLEDCARLYESKAADADFITQEDVRAEIFVAIKNHLDDIDKQINSAIVAVKNICNSLENISIDYKQCTENERIEKGSAKLRHVADRVKSWA